MAASVKPQTVTGIHVQADQLKLARCTSTSGTWHTETLAKVNLPEQVLSPRFNKTNILDTTLFHQGLTELKRQAGLKSMTAALALAPESTRILVKRFPQLPDNPSETAAMIRWSLSHQMSCPVEHLNLSWESFAEAEKTTLVVSLASRFVLSEYVTAFSRADIRIASVSPSVLTLYNLYAESIPETGTSAWIGIMDSSTSLIVFSQNAPAFVKTIRNDLVSGSRVDDVDMILQFFLDDNPGLTIDSCFITDTGGTGDFPNGMNWEAARPNASLAENPDIPQYAAAIGAAWSLA